MKSIFVGKVAIFNQEKFSNNNSFIVNKTALDKEGTF